MRGLLLGFFGAAVLIAFPAWFRLSGAVPPLDVPWSIFPLWAPSVTLVAVSEEIFLRGALFGLVERAAGSIAAVAVTAAVFALIHVPLYGWQALPLDLAVGVWLGGLRLAGGGVAAPAVAHAVADLAAWWVL